MINNLELLEEDKDVAGLLVHSAVPGQGPVSAVSPHALHHNIQALHHLTKQYFSLNILEFFIIFYVFILEYFMFLF